MSTECYECTSLVSMEDCVQFMKKTECPKPTDRCRNMTVQVFVTLLGENQTGFQRGCASQDECVFELCSGHFAEHYGEKPLAYNVCQMSCCEGDFCPEGNITITEGNEGPVKGARGGKGFEILASVPVTVTSTLLSLVRARLL